METSELGRLLGRIQSEKLRIAILDHPGNPRHPNWHTHGYGMFAANLFGVSALTGDNLRNGSMALKPGEELRVRYRVIIHPGDATTAGLARTRIPNYQV